MQPHTTSLCPPGDYTSEELMTVFRGIWNMWTSAITPVTPGQSLAPGAVSWSNLCIQRRCLRCFPPDDKSSHNSTHNILVVTATSGDTGKAALDGFKDVAGTGVVCFTLRVTCLTSNVCKCLPKKVQMCRMRRTGNL